MGFRKASNTPPSDQVNENPNNTGGLKLGEVGFRKTKAGDAVSTHQNSKSKLVSPGISPINPANTVNPTSICSKVDRPGYIAKELPGAKSSFCIKRKNGTLGLKSKRLKMVNEELIELKITWGQAQTLLRPPPNSAPSIVVIEGFEFEEYEEAPIIGRPTIFPTDGVSENIQWVQCEECYKWRKIPADVILPSRWTCSENSWDPESNQAMGSVSSDLFPYQIHEANEVFSGA